MTKKKSDYDFIKESIEKSIERAKELQKIDPDVFDEYDDHSLLKLICIQYWIGFFTPIVAKHFQSRGKPMIFVDSMAGSGITKTKKGISLCGSSPGALISANDKKHPFDYLVSVEIDDNKASTLEKRLDKIKNNTKVYVIHNDIKNVSQDLKDKLKKSIAFTLIDPQAFKGISWDSISPLLCTRGDIMVSWFEWELWRMRCSALSDTNPSSANATMGRITNLLGNEDWKNEDDPEELTNIFIKRVLNECQKEHAEVFKIKRVSGGNYFKMILFTNNKAKKAAMKWKANMERRLSHMNYDALSTLLDVGEGKMISLDQYTDESTIPQ